MKGGRGGRSGPIGNANGEIRDKSDARNEQGSKRRGRLVAGFGISSLSPGEGAVSSIMRNEPNFLRGQIPSNLLICNRLRENGLAGRAAKRTQSKPIGSPRGTPKAGTGTTRRAERTSPRFREPFLPNKANLCRFEAENGDGGGKQSQSKPIGSGGRREAGGRRTEDRGQRTGGFTRHERRVRRYGLRQTKPISGLL